jgi:hypothetical protein
MLLSLIIFILCLGVSLNIRRDIILVFIFAIVLFAYVLLKILVGFPVIHCEGIELVVYGSPETLSSHLGTKFTAAERALWVISNVPGSIFAWNYCRS